MIRSVLLLMVYLSFCVLGTTAPFIISLGYVWVDTVRPQEVTYFILNQFPVAFVMGAISTYSSTSGVVLPTFLPMIPAMAL